MNERVVFKQGENEKVVHIQLGAGPNNVDGATAPAKPKGGVDGEEGEEEGDPDLMFRVIIEKPDP